MAKKNISFSISYEDGRYILSFKGKETISVSNIERVMDYVSDYVIDACAKIGPSPKAQQELEAIKRQSLISYITGFVLSSEEDIELDSSVIYTKEEDLYYAWREWEYTHLRKGPNGSIEAGYTYSNSFKRNVDSGWDELEDLFTDTLEEIRDVLEEMYS